MNPIIIVIQDYPFIVFNREGVNMHSNFTPKGHNLVTIIETPSTREPHKSTYFTQPSLLPSCWPCFTEAKGEGRVCGCRNGPSSVDVKSNVSFVGVVRHSGGRMWTRWDMLRENREAAQMSRNAQMLNDVTKIMNFIDALYLIRQLHVCISRFCISESNSFYSSFVIVVTIIYCLNITLFITSTMESWA